MGVRQHKPEGVIAKLRQAHVRIAQGRSVVGEWLRRKLNARQRNGISGGEVFCTLMRRRPDRDLAASRQYSQAVRRAVLPPAGPGEIAARFHALAGCAHPIGSAGQAARGAGTSPVLAL